MSLRARGFNLDVDRDRLADSRDCLGTLAEHQVEITPFQRLGGDRPAGLFRVVRRSEQLHMQSDWPGLAVHGEVARDVAALRPRAGHVATLECDFGILLDIKKFRTA